MAKVNLPGPHGVLAERDGRTSRAFYDWFRRIQEQIDAGELSADEAITLIAEMATKLGSPDGTVENIPENVIRGGDGIVVYPNGDLRQNDVFIALDPNVEPEPPLPLGAFLTLGEALEGEPGMRGPPGRDGRDGAPAPFLLPDEPAVEFAIPGPMGPQGPAGRDGVSTLLFDFDFGEPTVFAPPVNLAYAYGNLPVGNLNSGNNATSATFWRGDGTWSDTLTGGFHVDGDTFNVDNTNNRVGINTAAPQRAFHSVGPQGAVASFPSGIGANVPMLLENNGNSNIGLVAATTGTTGFAAYKSGSATTNGFFRYDLNGSVWLLDVEAATVHGQNASGAFWFASSGSFGGGVGVLFVGNATTTPTSNPTGGAIWYVEGGASKARGSSGTTTTFAAASPHCPTCGSDYVHEWDNPERYGYLAVCMNCHVDGINSHTRVRGAWSDT